MKKILPKVILLLLLACMVSAPALAAAPERAELELVRVGLFYDSTARTETTLELKNGDGYRFGFYDEDRIFQTLGDTDARAVTIVPDQNLSLADGERELGRYHLRLSETYADFEDARKDADAFGGFPAYCNGAYAVLIGGYPSEAEAEAARDAQGLSAEVYTGSGRGVVILMADTAQPIFLFDCGSSYSLTLSPTASSGKTATQCGTYSYCGDFQFARLSGDSLTVVNFVPLEDYVKGVLPNEMSASWPLEALKAQAVCARTYAVMNQNRYRSYGFDLTDDINCQVYRGLYEATEQTNRAVDDTAGELVRYDGKVCAVYYFAADGGATEDSENVWSNAAIPYLRGVADPYEADLDFYCKSWSIAVPHALTGDISVTNTPQGNIMTLTANGQTYQKDDVRAFLRGLGARYTSRRFSVAYDEETDSYLISGAGYGHQLGMSQWGAYAMAERAMTYDQIISFYFTGAYVE